MVNGELMLDSGCLILEKSFTAENAENAEILSFFINRGFHPVRKREGTFLTG